MPQSEPPIPPDLVYQPLTDGELQINMNTTLIYTYTRGENEPKRNSKIHVNSGTNQSINTPMESNDMFHLENTYFCDYYSFNLTIFKEETKVRKERKAVKID